VLIEEVYVTDRGRKRRRTVRVDLDDVRRRLGYPSPANRAAWRRIREALLDGVGESTSAIWLEPLPLIAVDSDGVLVVSAPSRTRSLAARFWRLIAGCAELVGAMTAAAVVVSTTNQKEAS
jgi:hypothetical protein